MRKIFLILIIVSVLFNSCKKEPGVGGTSTIKGKVMVHDYNGLPPQFYDPEVYVSQEDDVYIIYGDDGTTIYSDRTKTSYDGSYQFEYLRKGHYRIFVYSDDTAQISSHEKVINVADVEIGKNKSDTDAPELVIIKQ